MNLEELSQQVKDCKKCHLHEQRANAVPGEGNKNADILFIGEAPGYNEDQQGVPFVGRAGKILDELLESVNLKREDIFITNIVKCRPPENRDPWPEEISTCTPFLEQQILLIQPKVLVPLGRFATKYLFKKYGLPEETISTVHGQKFEVGTLAGKVTIIPMYHPAVATYDPNKKPMLLNDFSILGRPKKWE